MYLVVHSAIGAVLASEVTRNPVTGFFLGWLAHYAADLIPHGDERAGEWAGRKNEIRRYFLLAGIDGLLVLILIIFWSAGRGLSPLLLAAVAGSVLPDVLWGLEKLFGRKIFGPLHLLHSTIHNYFRLRLPLWLGLPFQTALAVGLWYLMFQR